MITEEEKFLILLKYPDIDDVNDYAVKYEFQYMYGRDLYYPGTTRVMSFAEYVDKLKLNDSRDVDYDDDDDDPRPSNYNLRNTGDWLADDGSGNDY
jgi:hypothetical protein